MSLFSLMRLFTIRFRMLSAIAVVLGLLGMLGGAGMFGMLRIQSMSGDFMVHEFAEVKELGELRGALGAIRLHEKDMIIQQGNADAVKQAHTRWLASLEEAKKVASQFTQGAEDKDNAVARSLVQRLDSYREQFAGVARQLEAGGVDLASMASGAGGKAVAEAEAADKLLQELGAILQDEVRASMKEQEQAGTQTKWLFGLAVLVTVAVVGPLTWLNMIAICKPWPRRSAWRWPLRGATCRSASIPAERTRRPTCSARWPKCSAA